MSRPKAKPQWTLTQRPDKSGAPQWVVSYRIPPERWREHRIPRAANVAAHDEPGAQKYARAFVAKLGAAMAEQRRAAPEHGPVLTFRGVADAWTSGELHKRWPDHVPIKRSVADDKGRLATLYDLIGDVPIAAFTLDDADRAMAALPKRVKTSATRRQYAQLISKVLGLAVYPLRAIAASPLPRGWLPSAKCTKAFSYLYPAEDAVLLASPSVPFADRVLYGFLAREGLRVSEALALSWQDFDLERGSVTLDKNKTDDPRVWALSPGVASALARWRELRGIPDAATLVFGGGEHADEPRREKHMAQQFRAHLGPAGLTRAELFARTASRCPIRIHDQRACFVTLNLAAGRSEAWIADRTGHKSSRMINRYRRAARTAAELDLGTLAPLDWSLPELAAPAVDALVAGLAALHARGDEPGPRGRADRPRDRPHPRPHRRPHPAPAWRARRANAHVSSRLVTIHRSGACTPETDCRSGAVSTGARQTSVEHSLQTP